MMACRSTLADFGWSYVPSLRHTRPCKSSSSCFARFTASWACQVTRDCCLTPPWLANPFGSIMTIGVRCGPTPRRASSSIDEMTSSQHGCNRRSVSVRASACNVVFLFSRSCPLWFFAPSVAQLKSLAGWSHHYVLTQCFNVERRLVSLLYVRLFACYAHRGCTACMWPGMESSHPAASRWCRCRCRCCRPRRRCCCCCRL